MRSSQAWRQALRAGPIPWPCVHEFYSIATQPRIFSPPSSVEQALDQVAAWMESPHLVLLAEEGEYWPCLQALVSKAKLRGPAVQLQPRAALTERVPAGRRCRAGQCAGRVRGRWGPAPRNCSSTPRTTTATSSVTAPGRLAPSGALAGPRAPALAAAGTGPAGSRRRSRGSRPDWDGLHRR
jgi:hypothetical protein